MYDIIKMGDKMKDVNILVNNGVNVEKSLELFGDMNTYDETLNLFLNEIDSKINDLKKYKEIGDMNNYSIVIHGLKSEYRYLGFESLGDLCYKHELESKSNNLFFISDDFDNLINQINNSIIIAHKYFGEDTTKFEVPKKIIRDKKILVVDDSNLIRNFIEKIFADSYEVVMATDGQVALNIIKENQDDIAAMLLDLNMPNVNGFDVLEYFKQNNLFKKVPVSIISGAEEKETIDRAFTYDIVDLLAKPFNERDIKSVIEKTINFKNM